MINRVLNNYLKSEYRFFILVIVFQLIIQIYFYNRTITQIGINEHELLGFTTERHYENVAFNYSKYGQFASGNYPELTPETYRPPLWPFILSLGYNLFGFDMKIGLIINNILLFLCSILIFFICKKLFNSNKAGALSSFIFFLDPILIERANSNQS